MNPRNIAVWASRKSLRCPPSRGPELTQLRQFALCRTPAAARFTRSLAGRLASLTTRNGLGEAGLTAGSCDKSYPPQPAGFGSRLSPTGKVEAASAAGVAVFGGLMLRGSAQT